jgi:DNA-binding MarR family transcriptional regulator
LTQIRISPDVELLWSELTHTVARVSHLLDLRLQATHGLLLSDFDLLWSVDKAPGHRATMTELGQSAAMSPSGVTRAVDRLVAESLLARDRRWIGDRRRAYVRLTEAGSERLRAARETYATELRTRLHNYLDDVARDRLAALLERFS